MLPETVRGGRSLSGVKESRETEVADGLPGRAEGAVRCRPTRTETEAPQEEAEKRRRSEAGRPRSEVPLGSFASLPPSPALPRPVPSLSPAARPPARPLLAHPPARPGQARLGRGNPRPFSPSPGLGWAGAGRAGPQ